MADGKEGGDVFGGGWDGRLLTRAALLMGVRITEECRKSEWVMAVD
jgi:hypothetical protein